MGNNMIYSVNNMNYLPDSTWCYTDLVENTTKFELRAGYPGYYLKSGTDMKA
jgi:hypothetical protein